MTENTAAISGELLPCPFCSGEASVVRQDVEPQGDPWYGKKLEIFVRCTKCGASLFDTYFHDGFADKASAIAAWNTRTSPAGAASPSQVAVKPLEWTKTSWTTEWDYEASSIVGTFMASPTHWRCLVDPFDGDHYHKAPSLDAAKAAAQTDYEQRIRSALASPSRVTDEMVEAALAEWFGSTKWRARLELPEIASNERQMRDTLLAALASPSPAPEGWVSGNVPRQEGWYAVMHPGIDGFTIYAFGDYQDVAYWSPAEPHELEDFDGGYKGGWQCQHDEEGDDIFAFYGPLPIPQFPAAPVPSSKEGETL